jgi:hypothetical protein
MTVPQEIAYFVNFHAIAQAMPLRLKLEAMKSFQVGPQSWVVRFRGRGEDLLMLFYGHVGNDGTIFVLPINPDEFPRKYPGDADLLKKFLEGPDSEVP